jgi:hypothetical protein
MDDILIDTSHPMSVAVLVALREGRHLREDTPTMMARAARAAIEIDPSMSVSDAYSLVNRLWLR